MEQQPNIEPWMCCELIKFITNLHSVYNLQPETLCLAIHVLDHYTSKHIIHGCHYLLAGCAALLITAKYEDSGELALCI